MAATPPAAPARDIQPPRPAAERTNDRAPKERSIVVRQGGTIADLAFKTYGEHSGALASDLIGELNPGVDLGWIKAGEQLRLPNLDAGSLIRRQKDGGYRLIVGSFLSNQAAERERDRLRRAGYETAVTARKLAEKLVVYRLELTDLATRQAAQEAWKAGRANCWLQVARPTCERVAGR